MKKITKKIIVTSFIAGFSSVFILKYFIFGLEKWNKLFHNTDRTESKEMLERYKGL
jgi:glucan phosphoethanolaminetransferase (alkaline phosphatase superfamily)